MKENIDLDALKGFDDIELDESDIVLSRAIRKNGLNQSLANPEVAASLKPIFSIELKSGEITNQKSTGRCWMFAGLNVLRIYFMKKYNLESFEFSEAYLQFYDKLEKANLFLEKTIEYSKLPIFAEYNRFLLDQTIMDGGHYVMFTNLVKKYGLVPSMFMDDNSISSSTAELNAILKETLANGMKIIRSMIENKSSKEDIWKTKEEILNTIYKTLVLAIGNPPKKFKLEIKDKDDNFLKFDEVTPQEFYKKYIDINLDDYICISDALIEGQEQYIRYTSDLVNNVVDGDPVTFFNVDIIELKKAVVASLKANEPVWFAGDVRRQSIRSEGLLGGNLLQTKEMLGVKSSLNKYERLSYRCSLNSHAMVFTGVTLDENNLPIRYKVENSWGKDSGKDGFFIMDDAWFNEYVYQIIINKKYVSQDIQERYMNSVIKNIEPFSTIWSYFVD